MASVATRHIEVDDAGIARISGTRIKVAHLVMEKMANGWGPEELHQQFPQLSLAQIYAAFAFYYDHQSVLDDQIRQSLVEAERMESSAAPSPLVQRLRAQGKLP